MQGDSEDPDRSASRPLPLPPVGAREEFRRDRLTLVMYAMAGVMGYVLNVMGPAMPLIRADLGISRTIGGLHYTAMASGTVLLGFFVDRLARLWGRRTLFWAAGGGLMVAALLIGIGRHPAATLSGALIMGMSGSSLLATIRSALTDVHDRYLAVAITETDTVWSIGALLSATTVGALVAAGIGWREAFLVPAAVWLGVILLGRAETLPKASVALARGQRRPRLTAAYWFNWAALIPSAAAEWSIGVWGASYLVDIRRVQEQTASFSMTAYFGAIVVGRIVASRLARRVDSFPLFLFSLGIALAGSLVFWLANATEVNVAGLFVTGLGISALFPMLLTGAFSAAHGRADTAAARVSLAAGAAILSAPLTLGWIADQGGIRAAFGMVPALLLCAGAFAALGQRSRRRGEVSTT